MTRIKLSTYSKAPTQNVSKLNAHLNHKIVIFVQEKKDYIFLSLERQPSKSENYNITHYYYIWRTQI